MTITFTAHTFPALNGQERNWVKKAIMSHVRFNSADMLVTGGAPSKGWKKSDLIEFCNELQIDARQVVTDAHIALRQQQHPATTPVLQVTPATPALATQTGVAGVTLAPDVLEVYGPHLPEVLDTDPDAEEYQDDTAPATPAIFDVSDLLEQWEGMIGASILDDMRDKLEAFVTHTEQQASVSVTNAKRQAAQITETTDAGEHNVSVAQKTSTSIGYTTLNKMFRLKGRAHQAYRKIQCEQWDCPTAPEIDPDYVMPLLALGQIMGAFATQDAVWLYGGASTGKSSLARQVAAYRGSNFTYIPMSRDVELAALIGQRLPLGDGTGAWDMFFGQLLIAIQIPGNLIALDEGSFTPPEVIGPMQSWIEAREIPVQETGQVVSFAAGVQIMVIDNTSGHGDDSHNYLGTNPQNRAWLTRFNFVRLERLELDLMAGIISTRTGCPLPLADVLAEIMQRSENATATGTGELSASISLRTVMKLAKLLMQGLPFAHSAEVTVFGVLPPAEQEAARQIILAHCGFTQGQWAGLASGQTLAEITGATCAPEDQTGTSQASVEFSEATEV